MRILTEFRSILKNAPKEFWKGAKPVISKLVAAYFIFAFGLFAVEYGALYFAPTSKVGYFLKYSTLDGSSGSWKTASYDQVTVARQPHDCEWESAPLGAKHCHYEAEIENIRTCIAKDGKTPLISSDEGKTWTENTSGTSPSIWVSWSKVEE